MNREELLKRYVGGERDFRGLDLKGIDLHCDDLCDIRLQNSNLRHSNLTCTNFSMSDLRNVDMSRSDMRSAVMDGADMRGAVLGSTNLMWTTFVMTKLGGTVLDPMNVPNARCLEQFKKHVSRSGIVWCKGYRTRYSLFVESLDYDDGEWYKAPYFSTANTVCHPGLYVRPHMEWDDIIVWFRHFDCHNVNDKWRVKEFFVEESIPPQSYMKRLR